MNKPLGIDVSSYQGKIDWRQVANAGYRFAYIRATHHVINGRIYVMCGVDSKFQINWRDALAEGLYVGAYHYLECTYEDSVIVSPFNAQVYEFCTQIPKAPALPGILPPMLDLEEGDPDPDDVLSFLQAIEERSGLCPWIYTMAGWWNTSRLNGDDRFDRFPMVAADWTPPLTLPLGRKDHIIWQTTSKGRVPGINGDVDIEEFNGDLDMLKLLARV